MLIDDIERAFPVTPPPPRDRIAIHVCAECDALRDALDGKAWTDLDDAMLDANHPWLPLLTPEAFVYYLPACLRRSIANPSSPIIGCSECLRFTIYALCDDDLPDDEWWKERVVRFAPAQERVIAAFLEWVFDEFEPDSDDDYEPSCVRRGLELYWRARSGRPNR